MTQVGDVNSNERGSGARFNGGKVRLDYVPARILSRYYGRNGFDIGEDAGYADRILDAIAEFEESTDDSIEGLYRALDLSLRPLGGVDRWRDVCAVFDFGAKKYAAWNWAKGMAWSIPLACIKRHCVKILEGEKLDDESGLSHFGHIGCNLVMLLHYVSNYVEGDDRPARECFARDDGLRVSDAMQDVRIDPAPTALLDYIDSGRDGGFEYAINPQTGEPEGALPQPKDVGKWTLWSMPLNPETGDGVCGDPACPCDEPGKRWWDYKPRC
jgi:hypothetical protein